MHILPTRSSPVWQSILIALHFSWGDTKARYKRSILGPWWIVLGTAIGVTGLGILWSSLLKMDRAMMVPSLTIGLVVWQFITGCLGESASVFVRYGSLIRNISVPFPVFPLQMVLRQFITFLHNSMVILVVLVIFPPPLSFTQLLVVPGVLLVFGNLLWIALLVGMLGARYRDLEPLIAAVLPMLFFLSPVIYRPEHLGVSAEIIWANPFTYLITVIRDPLQGVTPSLHTYAVTVVMLVLGWMAALWLLNHRKHRIAFWV